MLRVDIILADAAQTAEAEGKAHLLGAGWSQVFGEQPMAVVIFIEVPWDETNTPMEWRLDLRSADGEVIELQGPAGPQAISIAGAFEAGRPPGLAKGTPIMQPPISVSIGPLPLPPGRYEWRFFVNDDSQDSWQRTFTKLAAPPGLIP
jgi:hypothetical protein